VTSAVFLKKLLRRDILLRVVNERLTETFAVNLLSLISLFLGFRARVFFDTVIRPNNAFSILRAGDLARELGYKRVTIIEFGVAAGAGLLNIAAIARKVTRITGIDFDIYGLDTGEGMPDAIDYRDHPEFFRRGDFRMDAEALSARLPHNCHLIIGNVDTSVANLFLSPDSPLGYVVLDVDYYSSSVPCLRILERDPQLYLPQVLLYADDVSGEVMNPWCGELLAISEFNDSHRQRKIAPYKSLVYYRPCKQGAWLERMFVAHILDSRHRSISCQRHGVRQESNPYL
jgi:hypothetical protein